MVHKYSGALTTGLLIGIAIVVIVALQRSLTNTGLSLEWQVFVIALVFTAIGTWIASNIKKPVPSPEPDQSKTDYKQLQYDHNQQELLSDRELEVLHLMASGLTNKAIADQLFVSQNTIKTHTANIYMKLEVSNRTAAVAKGQQLGLLSGRVSKT